MSAVVTPAPSSRSEAGAPQLRTILLTDLCDSTQLVERLGDTTAADLFRQHDLLVLQLQQQWRGRLIDRSDGMLLLFERPIDGLGFALDYGRGLRELGHEHGADLKARAGLHVGEVLTWRNSEAAVRVGAKPVEVEGLAKPMAARLMTMARPGQVLVSAVAEPLAHRSARELGERGQQLLWKSHGRWRFKGLPNPQEIFEVGEAGIAPLRQPKPSPKAWRDVPLWRRPAALVAELAIVVGIGLGIWFVTKPQPAIAFNERDWVVVADLRNLTGQAVLDDSLEQAFRISLEQSRYVNVLSDLKARQTLERMRLPPDTELTRAIASEIAIRDGARAVILPTVAEVGGQVRVSAEVIDPHSQTTIYSHYADGRGAASALESIDDVTGKLRARLGEAMKSIQNDSEPLPKVTTQNIDALKMYSLAQRAYAESDYEKARELYRRATDIDPAFALAYLGQVRVAWSTVSPAEAAEPFEKAWQLRDRLPPREQLYLDAWASEFNPGYEAKAKWQLLSEAYPDYFAGHANYAGLLIGENRFEIAETAIKPALVPQNPLRGISYDYMGRSALGRENYDSAARSFRTALSLGHSDAARRLADVAAVGRDYEEAYKLLNSMPESAKYRNHELITIALDQGDWALAEQAAARALGDVANTQMDLHRVYLLASGIVAYTSGADKKGLAYASKSAGMALAALQRSEPGRPEDAYLALASAHVAQLSGDDELAEKVLDELGQRQGLLEHPKVNELREIVLANIELARGKNHSALRRLSALPDGAELYQVHVALRRVYWMAEDYEAALREARWMADHRGLAYIELAGLQALQPLNVADSNLARLYAAEALAALGRRAEATREAEAFISQWEFVNLPDHLRRRVSVIRPASKQ